MGIAYNARLLSDIIEWDIPNWSAALKYWDRYTAHNVASVSALEIGSRHGGLSLSLALSGAHVVCTDVRRPTEESIRKHTSYKVTDYIQYAQVYALNIPHAGCFDIVLFKSVLGGLVEVIVETGRRRQFPKCSAL